MKEQAKEDKLQQKAVEYMGSRYHTLIFPMGQTVAAADV